MSNKYEIEYIDSEHLYLCNGVIIPSVTQILEKIFPDKYKSVPKSILMNKAEYGTAIHSAIQLYEESGFIPDLNYIGEASFNQYLELKKKYNLDVLEQEQIVNYKNYYAGRFDMIANVSEETCLLDIKTTAKLDKEYLSWQLSLYEYAYKSMNGSKNFKRLYAIWLPKKDLGELVEIKRKPKKEIEELLKKIRSEEE